MTTFGLVHGAGHGAWCWERLIPELAARGHRAVAVELPGEDPAAGCARYAEIVDATLPPADDLVLVGHSLGGLTVPLVAARRPARTLVFLCALIPVPGQSLEEQLAADPGIYAPGYTARPGRVVHPDGSIAWADEASAREAFYHDCTSADVRWAFARLRRQAAAPRTERCPLAGWPTARSVYVLGREDRAVNPQWSRRAARERLGVEAFELPGGHSPFLARPAALAALLDAVAGGG
ncbi:MAG TPA: alpha/beta hydrolase [Methylomirabilota bacterium]|jgi:pimeloyl-ACP methyl ester carboxylesterase|nr:alpha/beta hydrolase [Methylomirabilota bacterium]